MKTENKTLRDIAQIMGVSATTVHRALQGKGRVSEETRREALRVAAEIGYHTNYMAASLKRKNVRFAIALPQPINEEQYYFTSLWQGARQFLRGVTEFNIQPLEWTYRNSHGSNGSILKEIYDTQSGSLDGLLTMATDHKQSSYFIERFAEKGIPVVLIGPDLHKEFRLCCIKSYDLIAGHLGAELLTACHPADLRKKIIITGNAIDSETMPDQYQNSRGFEEYIAAHVPGITLLRAYNADSSTTYGQIRQLLQQNPDTYAIYSCSARHTIPMCKAAVDQGVVGKVRLVGNDRFPESDTLLREGVLTAIIDKKIMRQSSLAMEVLFNYVVKSEYPTSNTLYIRPTVVMRSSLQAEKSMVE